MKTVNVIGCGSVGSVVADVLPHFGVTKLRLIDKESLDAHNVARHLCGMDEVNQPKAEAVGRIVGRHAPEIDIDPINQSILDVLLNDADRLAESDVSIIALAEAATERRLNRYGRAGALGRLCFTWVEPFMAAGHIMVVDPDTAGCLECVLAPDGAFELAVVRDGRTHMRRDAGCGGSFTPYAGVDVQRFVATAVPVLVKLLSTERGSHLVTVIGDLDLAGANGVVVESRWAQASPFSVHVQQVTARDNCPVCKA